MKQHASKSHIFSELYRPIIRVLIAATAALIANLLGFGPLALLFSGFGLLCMGIDLFLLKSASKKRSFYCDLPQNSPVVPPNEVLSFEAGLKAARSPKGFFQAWTIKQSYTHYSTYRAAKYMAEDNDEWGQKILQKIRQA